MRKFRGIVFLGKCNLRCWYCDKPEYVVEQEKVIASLNRVFSKFQRDDTCIRVECRGEITLYRDIINYLERRAEEGYRIEILTNGLLLRDVLGESTKIRCVVSLDGHTKSMNSFRHLNKNQVETILNNIFYYNAEIQSVYLGQTMEEMNDFINYLQSKSFNQRLHIFPCSIKGKLISKTIDYDTLQKASFLPPEEYFNRWKFIMENQRRDFVCDYFKNGYTYYIHNDDIAMIKCDGTPKCHDFRHEFGEERSYDTYPCNTCINHNEYNNMRKIINEI
ncbi:MAG: radical SAM protein [Bacillota bacterium]